ncbi:MAG: PIN domain-containing protein [Propionibacteriaceae bacterium]|nr:PIN domain-containing protein [Propionibacteriaceae bacterium]
MIVLDTNIISVLMNPTHQDYARMTTWKKDNAETDFYITSVSLAEIAQGIAILPDGSKKHDLLAARSRLLLSTAGHVLTFDTAEANAYGEIMAQRKSQGRRMSILDAQIAACTYAAGATLATRNTKDFTDCGITVVDPYSLGN